MSLTGIYDCPLLNNYKDPELSSRLERLRQVAIDTNKEYAELLGIPISAAITCVKPSGCTTLETEIMTEHGKRSMAEIFSEYSSPLNAQSSLRSYYQDQSSLMKICVTLIVQSGQKVLITCI